MRTVDEAHDRMTAAGRAKVSVSVNMLPMAGKAMPARRVMAPVVTRVRAAVDAVYARAAVNAHAGLTSSMADADITASSKPAPDAKRLI
ncbi:MAG: hypothetical protein R3174_03380 [Gammaproteobacteria bacterium]|nr:hypothetical protein [Gammaproteobacteria bacterium]